MSVLLKAKQVREAPPGWEWTEPSVWTSPMLTALEKGVKGGLWFSLIDKVYDRRNLRSSFERVKRNRGKSGVDHVTVGKFSEKLEEEIEKLHVRLKEGTYHPQKVLRVDIPKPGSTGTRPLGIPTVRDRVVQGSLRNVIEPIFEKIFSDNSYGFRPGRNCKDALRAVNRLLCEGYLYVLDADIKSYFDSIDHTLLMGEISEQISDSRIHGLVEKFLKQEVLYEAEHWIPEKGSPQGGVISPLLSNIYLNKLDHHMTDNGYRMVRYADDFVVLCKSREEAQMAMKEIEAWMRKRKLSLNQDKSHIVDMTISGNGFDYLGYHFGRTKIKGDLKFWPSHKSRMRFRERLRPHMKRCNGKSLDEIISKVNPILKGWYEYYRHSTPNALKEPDGWVRMRLRSILRKRRGGKGRGRGFDHNRWPNKFFAANGLFSLYAARCAVSQSSRR